MGFHPVWESCWIPQNKSFHVLALEVSEDGALLPLGLADEVSFLAGWSSHAVG